MWVPPFSWPLINITMYHAIPRLAFGDQNGVMAPYEVWAKSLNVHRKASFTSKLKDINSLQTVKDNIKMNIFNYFVFKKYFNTTSNL